MTQIQRGSVRSLKISEMKEKAEAAKCIKIKIKNKNEG